MRRRDGRCALVVVCQGVYTSSSVRNELTRGSHGGERFTLKEVFNSLVDRVSRSPLIRERMCLRTVERGATKLMDR